MPDYISYETMIEHLRGAGQLFRQRTESPNVDKKGIGFNKDSRHAAVKVNLTFDSWAGNYGNSSCSTVIGFSDHQMFQKAFVTYLNKHWEEIFKEMADDLEKEAAASKAVRIKELETELNRLKEVSDE